jgi:hypothetical protein
MLAFNTSLLTQKVTRDSCGVCVMKLRPGDKLRKVKKADADQKANYFVESIPRAGVTRQTQVKQLEIPLENLKTGDDI